MSWKTGTVTPQNCRRDGSSLLVPFWSRSIHRDHRDRSLWDCPWPGCASSRPGARRAAKPICGPSSRSRHQGGGRPRQLELRPERKGRGWAGPASPEWLLSSALS